MSGLSLPYRPLGAEDCNAPADALEEAIRHLVDQGVAVPPSSRLPHAVRLLRTIAQRGAYPGNHTELLPIANAIKAGFDFTAIGHALPRIPNAEVLEACRRAVRGLLTDAGPTDAHRAQTQLQFGCVLAEAGLSPAAVQPVARKVPDYVVDLRGLPTAIEVKRPAALAGIQGSVRGALAQCRDFTQLNALALDLTDCVALPSALFQGSSAQAIAEAARRFREGYSQASDYIQRRKADPGFARCGVLWAFAGATFWPSEEPCRPLSKLLVYGEAFHHAVSGLLVEQSRRLRDSIVNGFRALGASI